MSTTRAPVSGRLHCLSSFGLPPAVCSISTTTFFTPATRSIAPPIPFTILPGIIQFARSPFARHLQRAQDGQVDMPAADHPEGLSR